tara:strand:- start:349 stop:477 length:129 start_codon:yes stop_codon:yes gene_type:complete
MILVILAKLCFCSISFEKQIKPIAWSVMVKKQTVIGDVNVQR